MSTQLVINENGSVDLVTQTVKRAKDPKALLARLGFTAFKTEEDVGWKRYLLAPDLIMAVAIQDAREIWNTAIRVPSFYIRCSMDMATKDEAYLNPDSPDDDEVDSDNLPKVVFNTPDHAVGFWFVDIHGTHSIFMEATRKDKRAFYRLGIPNCHTSGDLCTGRLHAGDRALPPLARHRNAFVSWQNNACNTDLDSSDDSYRFKIQPDGSYLWTPPALTSFVTINTVATKFVLGEE